MSLFTASMLGLTLSSNIVQLYAFWELVGVSSYLLIGFWHERPAAAAAAKKAFIVTRIGDVGFLIAILYLSLRAEDFAAAGLNAFHIPDIWQAAQPVAVGAGRLRRRGADLDGIGHLRWRRGKVGAVSASRLAARRHGRAYAGKRADTRGDDGGCRRIPWWPASSPSSSSRNRLWPSSP